MEPFRIKKFIKSFGYAGKGIRKLIVHEQNARIHLVITVVVIIGGFAVNLNRYEWLGICAVVGLVWAAEAFNTAIEKLADFVSPERQQQIGLVKDIAAGGVLICAGVAVGMGLLIFIPHFM